MDRDVLVGLIELQKHPQDSGSSPEDKELSNKLESSKQAYWTRTENKAHHTDAYRVGWFTDEGAGHAEDLIKSFVCDNGWLEEHYRKPKETGK